jgi:hypothetical protein
MVYATMTVNEIATAAAQLAPEQKVRLLARLAFELTIAARDTYVPGSKDIAEPHQLRAFNEMQHRVTSCLSVLLVKRTDEDDAWLWPFISESSKVAGCVRQAAQACSRAMDGLHINGPQRT